MRPILEGIRIVDWSVHQVGPMAAAFLADLGADVIHVEVPGQGDPNRGIFKVFGMPLDLPHGRHAMFEEHNRNKRGIAINMKTPRGKEIIYRLVETSDVFITNLRPQARFSLGMNYDTLRQHNPKLIYASATGLGEDGPYASMPSLDVIAQAWAGALAAGVPNGAEPCWGIPNAGDRGTALQLAYGVLAALFARDRQGEGQEVKVSQLGTIISFQGAIITPMLLTGYSYDLRERTNQRNPLYNFYQCKDGKWITIGCFSADDAWPGLCAMLGVPGLETDPRFQGFLKREEHCRELVEIFDHVFATKTRAEWLEIIKERDLLGAPINDYDDVIKDPQVLANGYVTDWDHPVLGKVKIVGSPVKFSKTPCEFRRPAPEIGEHNEEVLLELGYSWEDISQFYEQGVF